MSSVRVRARACLSLFAHTQTDVNNYITISMFIRAHVHARVELFLSSPRCAHMKDPERKRLHTHFPGPFSSITWKCVNPKPYTS